MAKSSRGLPSNFNLQVPSEPAELEDYLDATTAPRTQPPNARPVHREVATNVIPIPPPEELHADAAAQQRRFAQTVETVERDSRATRAFSRKQLNLNPETLRMVDELLELIRKSSPQKDTKASEMFLALVSTLYEARQYLWFNDLPLRGRWGTPTARAFPIALKTIFQSAITQSQRRGDK